MNCEIEIDGSIGGGSVLRVAVPLALGIKKSIRINNIRANRKNPGLRQQHLLGLELLAEITGSKLHGGAVGSTTIEFIPNQSNKHKPKVQINIPTAASVSLILQALSNYAFVSRNDLELVFDGGGSHTNWSPNLDYVKYVTNPIFQKFGQTIEIHLVRTGFYPKGGANGIIKVKTQSSGSLINLEGSKAKNIEIILVASDKLQKANVLERQLTHLSDNLGKEYNIMTNSRYEDTASVGTSVTVILKHSSSVPKGISKLGEKGVSSEKIAARIYEEYIKNISNLSAVDEYMADQLILPLAFCKSGSSITIPSVTKHVRVNLDIVNSILGKCIKVQENSDFSRLTRL